MPTVAEQTAVLNPASVTIGRNGKDFLLTISESSPGAGDGGVLTLVDNTTEDYSKGIDQVVFADGTVWTRADMRVLWLASMATSGNDTINGFLTADTINGGAGNDTLFGDFGSDTLTGGTGVDRLTGSYNADTFRFYDGDTGTGAAADTITDFAAGSDKIHLASMDANTTLDGDQAFVFLGTAVFTNQAGNSDT